MMHSRGMSLPALLVASLMAMACGRERSVPTSPEETRQVAAAPGQLASVSAAASAKLKLDQSNDLSDGLSLGNGLYGQTFVPKAKNLARLVIRVTINTLTTDVPTTVGLYRDITGVPIATSTVLVAHAEPGELSRIISFEFDPPVPLDKGSYTLGLNAPFNVSWEFAYGNPYPLGQAEIYDGTPINPPADFVFATYELK